MPTLRPELLDELLADYEKPEDLLGEQGLFKQLKKALLERALGAELSEHLGYEKGDPAGRGTGNSRNGYSDKTVLTEDGEIDIAVPRDGERHHPLAAVYRAAVLQHVERLLSADRLRPRFLFDEVKTREVDVEHLRAVDRELATLENLNHEADYLAALAAAGFK